MMRKIRVLLVLAALSLAATALLPCNSLAQQTALSTEFFAAGSSAQFNTFALAAGLDNVWQNQNAPCGEHHFTMKNGAELVDPRSSSILPEKGNLWIVWNDAADAGTGGTVCSYIAVDSVVGNRAYFAKATMTILASAGAADAGIVPGLGKSAETLPQTVINYLNGQTINVAMTDIRPEDAKFATIRALTGYGLKIPRYLHTGLGYSTGAPPSNPLGNPVYSAWSGGQANVVDYVILPTDTDPFTELVGARSYSVLNIGAAPVMVIYNYTNTGAGHLGDGNYTDINHLALYNALAGNYTHIRELSHTATVNPITSTTSEPETSYPLHTWQREPISGTFNTMEYDICLTRTIYPTYPGPGTYGQETGVNPTANLTACNPSTYTTWPCNAESGNPFYHIATNGATRGRAVGTGDMIKAVSGTPDSLGYAFWGFSNFNGYTGTLKYMTVDGIDPLFASPSANPWGAGVLPQCSGSGGAPPCYTGTSTGYPTFQHIIDGDYPIWSVYRAVYDPTVTTLNVIAMVNIAQHAVLNAATGFPDFVPTPSLTVFRSHYNQVVVTSNSNDQTPHNGYEPSASCPIEQGGDMGGAILTIQSELDYIADTAGANGCPASPCGCEQVNNFQ